MCGIAGIVSLSSNQLRTADKDLEVMQTLIAHRGPDGQGSWISEDRRCGLAHVRLAIIDLTDDGFQPMQATNNTTITYNGEIYNYKELRQILGGSWSFQSKSDTETILASYSKWGTECLDHLRGMFSFTIHSEDEIFAARDPFGIKPFYYITVSGVFYFASEMKALLPFLDEIETDQDALAEYLTFQYQVADQMLFKGIKTLLPGHALKIKDGRVKIWKYWDVEHGVGSLTAQEYADQLGECLEDSIEVHMNSDVPVGAYVSGGVDSSLIAAMSSTHSMSARKGFHGKFLEAPAYDESAFAEASCSNSGIDLHQLVITSDDFQNSITKTVYHLDQPVAGPGSFPQYMVSKLASEHVKVVLGGQGGDELFGGYARYMVGYLEQVLGSAISGTSDVKNTPLSLQDITPNLSVLKEYVPLMGHLFSDNLFGGIDERYFKLIGRSDDLKEEVDWSQLDMAGVFDRYQSIFNLPKNAGNANSLDAMTHFDFKCLLPALLQVEDRMSMAHGLEARVPLLDRKIVELAANLPSDIKFPQGRLKNMLKDIASKHLPTKVFQRRDKMGFPVPLREWYTGPLNEFVRDIFSGQKSQERNLFNADAIQSNFEKGGQFSRKTWGLLSLETWHQTFHDRSQEYRNMRQMNTVTIPKI